MSKRVVYVTGEQWPKMRPLGPRRLVGRKDRHARADDRLVFEGIVCILRTGARCKALPDRYPHPSTCWRGLREWYETHVPKEIWHAYQAGKAMDVVGIGRWAGIALGNQTGPALAR